TLFWFSILFSPCYLHPRYSTLFPYTSLFRSLWDLPSSENDGQSTVASSPRYTHRRPDASYTGSHGSPAATTATDHPLRATWSRNSAQTSPRSSGGQIGSGDTRHTPLRTECATTPCPTKSQSLSSRSAK